MTIPLWLITFGAIFSLLGLGLSAAGGLLQNMASSEKSTRIEKLAEKGFNYQVGKDAIVTPSVDYDVTKEKVVISLRNKGENPVRNLTIWIRDDRLFQLLYEEYSFDEWFGKDKDKPHKLSPSTRAEQQAVKIVNVGDVFPSKSYEYFADIHKGEAQYTIQYTSNNLTGGLEHSVQAKIVDGQFKYSSYLRNGNTGEVLEDKR